MLALDLFCGGGGACLGMQQAGFEVVGVDIKMHKNYPGHFIQGDIHALPVNVRDFDFVWASPPCQRFSVGSYCQNRKGNEEDYPNLIPITRKILKGHPLSCIENVPHAPIRCDLILNGPTLGLPFILRKRHFELSFWMWQPHLEKAETGMTVSVCKTLSVRNKHQSKKWKTLGLGTTIPQAVRKVIMGFSYFDKLTIAETGEAVPPPYAKFIADEAMRQLHA